MRAVPERSRVLWVGEGPETFADEAASLRTAGLDVTTLRAGSLDGGLPLSPAVAEALTRWTADRPRLDAAAARAISDAFDAVVICCAETAWQASEAVRALSTQLLFRSHVRNTPLVEALWNAGVAALFHRHPDMRHLTQAETDAVAMGGLMAAQTEISPAWLDVAARRPGRVRERPSPGAGTVMVSAPAPGWAGEHARSLGALARDVATAPGFSVDAHLGAGRAEAFAAIEARRHAMLASAALFYPIGVPSGLHAAPLEMMVLGGPVICLEGSSIARLLPADAPGRARTLDEALALCRRLADGDTALGEAIMRSQATLAGELREGRGEHGFTATVLRLLSQPRSGAAPVRRGDLFAIHHSLLSSEKPVRHERQLDDARRHRLATHEKLYARTRHCMLRRHVAHGNGTIDGRPESARCDDTDCDARR